MHDIGKSLHTIQEIGLSTDDFCVTSNAGLALATMVARKRHLPSLTERTLPGDLDLLVLPHAWEKIRTSFPTAHENGIADCLNVKIGGDNVNIELTRHWPSTLSTISTRNDLAGISIVIEGGIRIMDIGWIAAFKETLFRPKDLLDLSCIREALRSSPRTDRQNCCISTMFSNVSVPMPDTYTRRPSRPRPALFQNISLTVA